MDPSSTVSVDDEHSYPTSMSMLAPLQKQGWELG